MFPKRFPLKSSAEPKKKLSLITLLFLPRHALHFFNRTQTLEKKKNISDSSTDNLQHAFFVSYPNVFCKGMQAYTLNVSVWCRIVQFVCLEDCFFLFFLWLSLYLCLPTSLQSQSACRSQCETLSQRRRELCYWCLFKHSMVFKSCSPPLHRTAILFGLKIRRKHLNTKAFGDKDIRLRSSLSEVRFIELDWLDLSVIFALVYLCEQQRI